MSDQEYPDLQQVTEKKLTSERYPELLEAIELLYIKNNMSARIRLIQEWPDVARRILGDELIRYDMDGADDLDRRAVLEDEAEERRLALYETVKNLEDESVKKGVLQLDYVEGLVKEMGREFSSFLYAPHIVDKFLGAAPKVETPEPEAKPAPPAAQNVDEIVPVSVEASMPDVAPIDVQKEPASKPKVTAKFQIMPKSDMPDVKPIDTPAPPKDKAS